LASQRILALSGQHRQSADIAWTVQPLASRPSCRSFGHTAERRIFRKLGVNDQPALVRVLMRAVAVLPANGRDAGQTADVNASVRPSNAP
jgi:cyanophycinase-like exopeptidase